MCDLKISHVLINRMNYLKRNKFLKSRDLGDLNVWLLNFTYSVNYTRIFFIYIYIINNNTEYCHAKCINNSSFFK